MSSLREELRTFFAHRLPDAGEAEDFTQRVFLRAVEDEKGFDRTLLFTIAKGLLRNEYRDAAREGRYTRPAEGRACNAFEDCPFQGVADRAALLDPENDWGTTRSPAYTFEDAAFDADFDGAVRALDPDLRDAFILGELRGLPCREAAPLIGTSFKTVTTRRAAATASIRKELLA